MLSSFFYLYGAFVFNNSNTDLQRCVYFILICERVIIPRVYFIKIAHLSQRSKDKP